MTTTLLLALLAAVAVWFLWRRRSRPPASTPDEYLRVPELHEIGVPLADDPDVDDSRLGDIRLPIP